MKALLGKDASENQNKYLRTTWKPRKNVRQVDLSEVQYEQQNPANGSNAREIKNQELIAEYITPNLPLPWTKDWKIKMAQIMDTYWND